MAATATAKTGKNLDAFRASHDKSYIVPKRISDALAKMGEAWCYEQELLKLAGLSTTDLAGYRDGFADFWLEVGGRNPKRVWAGTKAYAAKLRSVAQ